MTSLIREEPYAWRESRNNGIKLKIDFIKLHTLVLRGHAQYLLLPQQW
jgi:hypothetical protein